jgi:hypothetical protein
MSVMRLAPLASVMRLAPLAVAAGLAAGCATRSADVKPEPVPPEQFATWRCEQLAEEVDRVQQRAADVAYAVDAHAGNNIIALSLGLTVFWPALIAMRPDGPDAAELASLKGRFEALHAAAAARGCPPPADHLPGTLTAGQPVAVGERLVYEERSGQRGPAREVGLTLESLKRSHLEFALDVAGERAARPWQQDTAGNPAGAPPGSGLVTWSRLLRRDLELGDVLAGSLHEADGSSGRVRGQVIATGVKTSYGRPFDAAVVELFGDVPQVSPVQNGGSTRVDGVMVVDRKSGVLLRLELHSANPEFQLRRTLVRIEPAS